LHGGLEDEIGAAGIVAAFGERRGPDDSEVSSAHEVFELAGAGSPTARAVVDHVASRLGTAIATVCAILDPALVVLGGGIGANPLLLRPVRGSAAALAPITARIETSLLGERTALQGAIAVALQAARTTLLSPGAPPPKNLVAIAPTAR
jgi:predicted NBD/HSP70 family sugar kinase